MSTRYSVVNVDNFDIMMEVQDVVRNATAVFERLKASEVRLSQSTVKERKQKLKALENEVLKRREDIRTALRKDFKRTDIDTDFVDIYPVLGACRHTRANLRWWVMDKRVSTPLMLVGSSSWIRREAKGVSLIISPWNYPLNLALCSLVSAVAAGCPVVLKPSEVTPHLNKVMTEILGAVFASDEVVLIEGDKNVSAELLKLPWRHIFFTGSTAVGKIVMEAAAKNLASVTLELGGKSPSVVDRTADIRKAAKRIVTTKMANAGQTCIAPDYLLVHEDVKESLIESIKSQLRKRFHGKDWSQTYTGIINAGHAASLQKMVDEAASSDAAIWQLEGDIPAGYMKPTLIELNGQMDLELMREEIFGPVLPIISYQEEQEVLDIISVRNRPLSLSIFSRDKDFIQRVMSHTRAGNTAINHSALHFYNHNLPFGGVSHSGIGKSHGLHGFMQFTNERAIFKQWFPISLGDLLIPPLGKFIKSASEILIKKI